MLRFAAMLLLESQQVEAFSLISSSANQARQVRTLRRNGRAPGRRLHLARRRAVIADSMTVVQIRTFAPASPE